MTFKEAKGFRLSEANRRLVRRGGESNPKCRNCGHHFSQEHIWCMGDIICNQCDCVFKPFKGADSTMVDRYKVWESEDSKQTTLDQT